MKWEGERAMPSPRHKKRAAKEEDEEKKKAQIFWFSFEALFLAELRKVRLNRERRRREAATPSRTYSSPPFSPCAPFCTAPWVWLSGPGPHPRPQKWDLARPSLHRGEQNQTERLLRNCPAWGPRGPYEEESLTLIMINLVAVSLSQLQKSHRGNFDKSGCCLFTYVI